MNVDEQPSFLRIETTAEHGFIRIPDFVKVVREVTHDRDYTTIEMSRKDHKMPENDRLKIKEMLQTGKKNGSKVQKNKVNKADSPNKVEPSNESKAL